MKSVFRHLQEALERNYRLLVESGYKVLLEKYRKRSLIFDLMVKIYEDAIGDNLQLMHEGVVQSIGDHLELNLRGTAKPITRGRLALVE